VATCFWTFKKLQPIYRLEESTLISSRLDHKEGLHMWTKKQIAQDCKYKHLHPQKHNPPSISAHKDAHWSLQLSLVHGVP
jgi:hypothetical protein